SPKNPQGSGPEGIHLPESAGSWVEHAPATAGGGGRAGTSDWKGSSFHRDRASRCPRRRKRLVAKDLFPFQRATWTAPRVASPWRSRDARCQRPGDNAMRYPMCLRTETEGKACAGLAATGTGRESVG